MKLLFRFMDFDLDQTREQAELVYSILNKFVAASRSDGPPLLLGRRGVRGEEAHCRPGHTIV